MRVTLFDLETNGLLQDVTVIHCVSVKDPSTGEKRRWTPKNIQGAVQYLQKAADEGILGGHNIISYDIPVIQKLYPGFVVQRERVRDTLVMSRLIFSDLITRDGGHIKAGRLPGKLVGSHKLEAWGYRLGLQKGEYADDFKDEWIRANYETDFLTHMESLTPAALKKFDEDAQEKWVAAWGKANYPVALEWAEYSDAMGDYCDLDVEVTEALWNKLGAIEYDGRALQLEHDIRWFCSMMERSGWPFKVEDAGRLYATLAAKRDDLRLHMMETFPPLVEERISAKTGKQLKAKVTEFNPGSRDQIAQRLIRKYGWEPKVFTEGGKPVVDEVILSKLDYPEAKILSDYFLLEKRIGQLAEGNQAWLKSEKQGHIHHSCNTNGAVTGRCTHSSPNIAQVPSVRALWGEDCRRLFTVRAGFRQVGADLSGIELRCLAHFMAKWDDGEYGRVILDGDIHTVNQQAAGLPTRDNAKTFIYGWLYGAGDAKIGSITHPTKSEAYQRTVGKALKAAFLEKLPALGMLKKAVDKAAERGHLFGLDGRRISVRHKHAALNTLLQGAGAVIAKRWVIECFLEAERRGYRYGWDGDFTLLGFIHDEQQFAVREGLEQEFGEMVVMCAQRAGAYFNFKCPVGAEFKVGADWAECH
jgi:DNA polymerase I-like protein with 3'-5' exonuclease and polymerase domains